MASSCTSDEEESTDCSTDSWTEGSGKWWQTVNNGLTDVVLGLVFAWLEGRELALAGAVCRAWRAAAARPALWRRLLRLQPGAGAAHSTHEVSWREEFVRVHAGWELSSRLAVGTAGVAGAAGAASAVGCFIHAALTPCGYKLALTTSDAYILIWQLDDDEIWREVWRAGLQSRGWERAARAEWARGGRRLLAAGPLALARRWELLVLDEVEGRWEVASRAACGGGAAGCWAGRAGDAYLALQSRRLAPALHVTTVCINAATQETQSEHAGVTAPLLHIFNEEEASITHVTVAEVPLQKETSVDDKRYGSEQTYGDMRVLLAGFGGACGAVRAWWVSALRPPKLDAHIVGDLRARRARRAHRAARPQPGPDAEPEPEPTEQQVRAICTQPDAECRFAGTLIGLTVQYDGRAVWSSAADAGDVVGALSAWSLPELRPLRTMSPLAPRPLPALRSDSAHYVQPAVGPHYLATPEGGLSGCVWVWGAASGAPCPAPVPHAAPALVAAFPSTKHPSMLVLATDYLYVWRSKASPQITEWDMHEMD